YDDFSIASQRGFPMAGDDREARLAAQLRQNLRKRKAQVKSAAERDAEQNSAQNEEAREPESPRAKNPQTEA
ncbi:MAG: hypothetical protein AAF615_09720, partial [Pseudomonadota bacterium]